MKVPYYVPLVYTLLTRIYVNRSLSRFYLMDFVLVVPTLIFNNILTFKDLYFNVLWISIALAISYLFYEVFYVINDLVATKHELAPTLRAPSMNVPLAITIRISLFLVANICVLTLISCDSKVLSATIFGVFICTLMGFLHNAQRDKLKRSSTHAAMRVSRWILISSYFAILNHMSYISFISIVKDLLVVYLPHLIMVELTYYSYNLSKLSIKTPKVKTPLFLSYGIWVPVLVLIVGDWLKLMGYYIVFALSVINNIKYSKRFT